MCLIILKNEGTELVPQDMLDEVWEKNPDGAGFIYKKANTREYCMIKGLMTMDALNEAIKKVGLGKDDFIAYHMRIATSGEIDKRGTHPFVIHNDMNISQVLRVHSTDNTMMVMHNGVIHDLNQPNAKYSDTQRFVTEYLTQISPEDLFNNDIIKALVEKFIDGSRLLLTSNKYGRILYGGWHTHGDYFISKPYHKATYPKNKQATLDDWWNYPEDNTMYDWNDSFEVVEGDTFPEYEYCDYCGQLHHEDNLRYLDDFEATVCHTCIKDYSLCNEITDQF